MNLRASVANAAWLASSLPAWQRFQHALRDPAAAQGAILRRQLQANRHCEYGRAHGFADIRTYASFVDRVPLTCHDDLLPWIERIARGEQSVLTTERVLRLMPTSGSTGPRKLIPYTASLQQEFNAAISPWIVDLVRQHPSVLAGPAYWSISPATRPAAPDTSAVPIGFADDSEYLGATRHRLIAAAMATPASVARATDMDTFRHLVLLWLLRQEDLRLVSVWHPSFLSLLLDAMPRSWERLLVDIEHGGCAGADGLPATLRAEVTALRPRPRRAAWLRRTGPERPSAIWPALRVVSCWGDGNAAFALAELSRRLPEATVQPKGLLSTEAFVSVPFGRDHPAAVCSHFFEFIDDRRAVRGVQELEPGTRYEVVVTTGGGLWRYRTGDHVEVSGFVGRTPSLRFIGRGSRISDLCGEKLSEAFVSEALKRALLDRDGTVPRFAMLAPDEEKPTRWRYTLYAEGKVPSDAVDRLEALLRENPHYAHCRDLGQLQALRIVQVEGSAYERFVAAEVENGARAGDIKPVALSTRPDWFGRFHPGGSS